MTTSAQLATPTKPRRELHRAVLELPDTAPPAERLFAEPHRFDFFQAMRLLELLQPTRRGVGENASPDDEIVRFRAAIGTVFPASSIAELAPASDDAPPPEMTVAFMGLTGPTGVLPAHYTKLLAELARDSRSSEKHALRAWLDLFNHRLISLFYRAWEKYRPWVAYQRGDYQRTTPDVFTRAVFSFAGLASAPRMDEPGMPLAYRLPHALARYAGLLAQRPRNAANLQAILNDYFALPFAVEQFCGEWIALDAEQQTCLGVHGQLGCDTIVGASLWDRQSKLRIRVGPLTHAEFGRLLPDAAASPDGPHLGEVAAVVRFYLGAELDFDIQLVLRGVEVPACQIAAGSRASSRLGWNTWLPSDASASNRDDAVFADRCA